MMGWRHTTLTLAATTALILALVAGPALGGLSADHAAWVAVLAVLCVVLPLSERALLARLPDAAVIPRGPDRTPASPRAPPPPA